MTVTTNLSSVTLNGNGTTTSFPFDFWVPTDEELQFWITDAAGILTQTTNCTVTLSGSGGTVVYPAVGGTVLPSGAKITIMRDMAFTQTLDLVNAATFHAEVIESALDKMTAQIQQVAEAVERSVKTPVSSVTTPDDILAELSADVASAAASAATATTQAGLADTARIAAEGAAASIPTFAAFGLTLAGTATASNARTALELGDAALKSTGTAAGTVCAGDDSRIIGAAPAASPTLTGLLTLPDGQIKFPATQNASADANTLDDYEEGTWTPTIICTTTQGSGTYTVQVGRYTKVGRMVHIICNLVWTSHTATGYMVLNGLPFAAGSDAHVAADCNSLTITGQLYLSVLSGSTQMSLVAVNNGARSLLSLDTNTELEFEMTYIV